MLVFAMVAHEYAHAAVALRQGDDTAYMLGRVTLNPLPHIDPWMSILLPALLWFGSGGSFTFGGAKPVPVNPRKFRNYRKGDILVSAAGVTTNLILAVVWSVVFVLVGMLAPGPEQHDPGAGYRAAYAGVRDLAQSGPLLLQSDSGSAARRLASALPRVASRAGSWYRGLQRFGYLPIFALMFLFRPVMALLLTPAFKGMGFLLHIILPFSVGDGWNIFQS